jgi:hypothetical protein
VKDCQGFQESLDMERTYHTRQDQSTQKDGMVFNRFMIDKVMKPECTNKDKIENEEDMYIHPEDLNDDKCNQKPFKTDLFEIKPDQHKESYARE